MAVFIDFFLIYLLFVWETDDDLMCRFCMHFSFILSVNFSCTLLNAFIRYKHYLIEFLGNFIHRFIAYKNKDTLSHRQQKLYPISSAQFYHIWMLWTTIKTDMQDMLMIHTVVNSHSQLYLRPDQQSKIYTRYLY